MVTKENHKRGPQKRTTNLIESLDFDRLRCLVLQLLIVAFLELVPERLSLADELGQRVHLSHGLLDQNVACIVFLHLRYSYRSNLPREKRRI